MPIIVNELVFKATIEPADTKEARTPPAERPDSETMKEFVQICVEEVLKVLEREKER